MGKEFSEASKAYLAGFLDGDGAIMACIERHQEKKYGFRIRIVVKITQKDRKILDWFFDQYQMGRVTCNRTTNDWLIKDQNRVLELLENIYPYLQVKKNQANYAMQILKKSIDSKEDLLKVAELADALSCLNVRSEGRRKNYTIMIQENLLP